MTIVRKWFGLLVVAFSLAGFAGSAAAQKIYTMAVQATGTNTVAVTITNVTPPSVTGNSTINSFQINIPSGWFYQGAPTSSMAATVVLCPDGTNVCVSGFNGLKSGGKNPNALTVGFNVGYGTGGSPPACGSSVQWTAIVYTGNFSNTTFQLVDINNNNSNLSYVLESLNCYTLATLPGNIKAATAAASTTVRLTNTNAAGGTAINSVALSAQTGVTITPSGLPSPLNVAAGAYVDFQVATSAVCGASGGDWGATVKGTSGSTPVTFSGTITPSSFTISDCRLAFTPPPASAVALSEPLADPIPGLTAYDGAGNVLPATSWDGTNVAWTANNGVTVTGGKSPSAGPNGSFLYNDVTLTGGTLGTVFTLTATAKSIGSVHADVTGLKIYPGVLFCGDTISSMNDPGSTGTKTNPTPGTAFGKRWDNKDGSTCVLVGYTWTNTILTNNSVSLIWDTATQPNAVFDYTVYWKPEFVDPNTGLPKRRVKVAWESDKYSISGPVYVWANACLSASAPAQYTTLGADITDVATSITVASNPGTLATPFAVVVGTERMTVTDATTSNWTVVRGAGGTTKATHANGDKVMTTPLPIDPNPLMPDGTTANPYFKKQVHMCIWDEEFQSRTRSGTLYDCSTQPASSTITTGATLADIQPVACVLRKTSVFDIGDGFMTLD